jgi:hypothetical protein
MAAGAFLSHPDATIRTDGAGHPLKVFGNLKDKDQVADPVFSFRREPPVCGFSEEVPMRDCFAPRYRERCAAEFEAPAKFATIPRS